jgi:hypothetical protein
LHRDFAVLIHSSSVIGRTIFKCAHSSSAGAAVLQFHAAQVLEDDWYQ